MEHPHWDTQVLSPEISTMRSQHSRMTPHDIDQRSPVAATYEAGLRSPVPVGGLIP